MWAAVAVKSIFESNPTAVEHSVSEMMDQLEQRQSFDEIKQEVKAMVEQEEKNQQNDEFKSIIPSAKNTMDEKYFTRELKCCMVYKYGSQCIV